MVAGVPSLLSRLGLALLLPADELDGLIRSAPHRYKVYQIPKRAKGQFRTIAQPAREVKALQYWVLKHILGQFEIHPAATAYRRNRSILQNAKPHVRSRFLLKLDFKDFFPSIKAQDFYVFMRRAKTGLSEAEIKALGRILFWAPKGASDLYLSIGAPTSPTLSNILMMNFDRQVSIVCREHRVAYTRYADDLSFSAATSNRLSTVESEVLRICGGMRSPRLTINQSKTVRVSKRDARRITGLILSNDQRVSIGRHEKRRIRASLHHFVTGRLAADEISRLRGMLAYVKSVEPSFLLRLRQKYGDDAVDRCFAWTSE